MVTPRHQSIRHSRQSGRGNKGLLTKVDLNALDIKCAPADGEIVEQKEQEWNEPESGTDQEDSASRFRSRQRKKTMCDGQKQGNKQPDNWCGKEGYPGSVGPQYIL
jgi:hypothetical protein